MIVTTVRALVNVWWPLHLPRTAAANIVYAELPCCLVVLQSPLLSSASISPLPRFCSPMLFGFGFTDKAFERGMWIVKARVVCALMTWNLELEVQARKRRISVSDDVMRFDVSGMTSFPPRSCLFLDCPGGMDESELGAYVTRMIICQAYQQRLANSHRYMWMCLVVLDRFHSI